MRPYLLVLPLIILTSCGQPVSTKKSPAQENHLVNGYLDLSSGLVGSSDLLTVTMDMPVAITTDQIVFKTQKVAQDVGETITCSMSFANGEAYQYSVSGPTLTLRNAAGTSYSLNRSGNDGNDIIGSWTWSGVENGMHIHRRFTIPNTGRLIMNMECES